MKRTIALLLFLILHQFGFSIQVTRTLEKSSIASGESVLVTLKIVKTGEDGIAKLLEDIPAGFRAEVINNGGGRIVPDQNDDLKIVWLTMPVNDSFIVQYRLLHIAKSKGRFFISGNFSFLLKGVKQDFNVLASQLVVEDQTVLKQKVSDKKIPLNSIKSEVYTIQLGVFSSLKDDTVFNGLVNVFFVLKEGKYRYYTGKFLNENEAIINLELIKSKGFLNAFVTKVKTDRL